VTRRKRTLKWTEAALADLEAIGDFIAQDDPVAARRWVRELIATARLAARIPYGGRRVPEFDQDELREVFLKRYRIVYRITARSCEVLTVFEGHKRLRLDDD
jgi:plasmid stabilization system protein ParE